MARARKKTFHIRVPASTANLGAGFDCLGLALALPLNVRATVLTEPNAQAVARSSGVEGSAQLPTDPGENLILRAMRHTAESEHWTLPPVGLDVDNEIPVASGLGSSAAATVAGIALAYAVAGKKLSVERALRLAKEVEGHADNVGAALLGGLVVTAVRADGGVIAVRIPWPKKIKVVAVTPILTLETRASRAVLPPSVAHRDAVHNLQRSALFVAALDQRRYELVWDALQDRLHQRSREPLIPGLSDVLALPRMPGLLGVVLSGAGPTIVALATGHFAEIGKKIAACFEQRGLKSSVRVLAVAQQGASEQGG
jgi:homoserine kinase